MADEQPKNWPYYVAFDEIFDDPNATFSSNTEACRAGLDKVIAEVRKDVAQQIRDYGKNTISNVWCADDSWWNGMDFAADLAEGNTDRG